MGLGHSKEEPKPVKEEKGGIFNIFVKKSPPPPPPPKKNELKEALPIVGAVVLVAAIGKYLIDKKVWTKIPGFRKKDA